MKIDTYKLDVAGAVMVILKALIGNDNSLEENATAVFGAYQNGREQGFSVHVYYSLDTGKGFRFACWSEQRNSDQIVIYTTTKADPMQSITDEMYQRGAHVFHPGDWGGAAQFILNFLY